MKEKSKQPMKEKSKQPMKEKSKQQDTSRYHVPNLERALVILEHLAETPEGATITEIAGVLGFPKNSVFRILSTLYAHEYLSRDASSQKFRMNGKLLGIGYRGVATERLVANAMDIMRRLRDATGETVLIGKLIDGKGVVLDQIPTHHPIKVEVTVGVSFPLHVSAPGKAILAWMSEDEREAILADYKFTRYTSRTIMSRRKLREVLEEARRCGYALDYGEEVDGINCVAAPVLDHRGSPVAAIWTTGPEQRLQHQHFSRFGKIVVQHAEEFSGWLGYVKHKARRNML